MARSLVIIAGLFEVGFAAALKESHGFSRPVPMVLFVVCAIFSFVLLSRALRSLPIGSAYAVWTGIGGAGTAIVGMLFLGDPAETLRLLSIVAILAGVVGLQLSSSKTESGDRSDKPLASSSSLTEGGR